MKKFNKENQKLLAVWALDCAEHVLPLFEKAFPNDNRPRKAIEIGRKWILTGAFRMSEIRGASLSAHASAKDAKENSVACFVAHAAGQAVATAHVTQHAYGGAYYALKAISAVSSEDAKENIAKEFDWIKCHLPKELPEEIRREVSSRIIIENVGNKILIKIRKDKDY